MEVAVLNAEGFDQFLENNSLAVIEFTAQWCAPCRSFSSTLRSVAQEFQDFAFAEIDIDHCRDLADEFGVRSVPFVMIIKNSTIIYAESGALSRSALVELLVQAREVDTDQG